MKRLVKLHSFSSPSDTVTIIIDKNDIRVEDKNYPDSDARYCIRYITQLIDMDQWKHSWYMSMIRLYSNYSIE